jgi:hypothetical protein
MTNEGIRCSGFPRFLEPGVRCLRSVLRDEVGSLERATLGQRRPRDDHRFRRARSVR